MVAEELEAEKRVQTIEDSVEEAADFYRPLADWEPVKDYPCIACLNRREPLYENCALCGEQPLEEPQVVRGEHVMTISPSSPSGSVYDPDDPLPKWVSDMEGNNLSAESREKHVTVPIVPACVARPVSKKELEGTPKALKAREKEWNNLRDKGTWNLKTVREWRRRS